MKPAQRESAFKVDDAIENFRRQPEVARRRVETLAGFDPDGGSAVDAGSRAINFRPQSTQIRLRVDGQMSDASAGKVDELNAPDVFALTTDSDAAADDAATAAVVEEARIVFAAAAAAATDAAADTTGAAAGAAATVAVASIEVYDELTNPFATP